MPVTIASNFKLITKDADGFHYRHPERSCSKCLKYPCITGMENLRGDYAKYGCVNYENPNIFDVCQPKK